MKIINANERNRFAKKFDLFISYRRMGGKEFAGRLHDRLEKKGYRVFLDVEKLNSGKYRKQIFTYIEHITDFLLVLSPNALNFSGHNDLFQEEIEYALKCKKHIILITLENFEWPEQMTETVQCLKSCDHIPGDHRLFAQTITALTTKDKKTKKRLLQAKKHWNFKKSLLFFGMMLIIFMGIGTTFHFYYARALPVFSLGIKQEMGFIEYSDNGSWALEYTLTNKGGSASSVTIKPEGYLNFSVMSQLGDIPYRMANMTLGFQDFFSGSYSFDDMNNVSANIYESNADSMESYLAAIDASLQKYSMYIQEYVLKIYFDITYTDAFGITHHELMEPENNYNYISTLGSENYRRYISDTTLLKCQSAVEPYMTLPIGNGSYLNNNVEVVISDLKSDESLFNKDCIYHDKETNMKAYVSSYFPCSYLIYNKRGLVGGSHVLHKNCTHIIE